ncbi:MAG: DUF2642 domain-containing protein [Solibacillus sp.]
MVSYGQMDQAYFAASMQGLVGQMVAVQMTGNHVKQGLLKMVTTDYLVLDVCRVPFYIRICEVQWISPVQIRNKVDK